MILTNNKLADLLAKKKIIVDAGRKADKELTELKGAQEKRIAEIKKIDAKARDILIKETFGKGVLKEWEEPRRFELREDGNIEITIVNVIDEFKENYKKQLKEFNKENKKNKK